MIGIYLIGSLVISILLFINRNKLYNYLLITLFTILQWTFTVYEYNHLNIPDLTYFTPDSLAIIFLGILSIICIPVFYHSYIYFAKGKDIPRERGIYYGAMIILLTALSAAYLSNHIAI